MAEIIGSIDLTEEEARLLCIRGNQNLADKAKAVLALHALNHRLDRVCEYLDRCAPGGQPWTREDAKALLSTLEKAGIITIKDPAAT